ncbi:MAG: type II toxin-antitoxin system VapC family toxin [Moraxellaceae bacterium]|jgi:PIN domain nuclease of toxin-antitoxin system|nr:type II toxin-antitoxin system VapC family toxin [Moraxellaceae bacterium]
MRILLDTHIVLWALDAPQKLTTKQIDALQNPANQIFVSSISIAELMIKCSIGKLSIDVNLLDLIQQMGFDYLDYTPQDALGLKDLPFIHRDPFDRMLITQAKHHRCIFMSNDAIIQQYDCNIF